MRECPLGYSGGKHLDSLTPKKGSTKAKNELRKRKKIIEARFDTVLQVWRFGHPYNKSRKINFIGDHTLLNKKCRKFYILGGKFFLFWWNRKNAAYRAEKPCFGRKMAGNGRKWQKNMVFPLWKPHFCNFVKIKKIRHLICKISDIFCLAKYDLQWSWFFDFYYMGVQIFKPAELYQNVLQLFFSFSQFIFSLSRTLFWCQRISIKHFVVFSHRLIQILQVPESW